MRPEMQEVNITYENGGTKPVMMWVVGFLGIHEPLSYRHRSSRFRGITHIPTGTEVFGVVKVPDGKFYELKRAVTEINFKFDLNFNDLADSPLHLERGIKSKALMQSILESHGLEVIGDKL